MNNNLNTEGDINLSPLRKNWKNKNIDRSTEKILNEDEKYFLHQSLSTPCLNVLKSAEGIYINDIQGNKIMDFHGNNVHQLGYKNESIIKAIKKEIDILPFSPRRYTNLKSIKLAKRLAELAPGDLNKVLFAPGGSEAVSMALKLARKVTGKFKVISLWDSFHGATLDAISVGGEAVFKKGMGPMLTGTEHILAVNNYRCIFGECSSCGLKCLDHFDYVLDKSPDTAAVIIETIRNTDVQLPPKNYFKRVREICDKHNVLLILDEIPIAFGRTAKMFAVENYGIVPDMLIVGKGLGGGVFPLSALIADVRLDTADDISLGHFTHEKTPLGAAAGLAVIDYIEEYNILEHTQEMHIYMKNKLYALKDKYNIIGDIRGIGLLFGVELVKDRESREKAESEAEKVMYYALENGLNFKISKGNVLSLSPPLIINKKQIDKAISIIDNAFKRLE